MKMKINYELEATVYSSRHGASFSQTGEPPKPHQGIENFISGLGDLEIKLDEKKSSQIFPQSKVEMSLGENPEVASNPIAYILVKAQHREMVSNYDLTLKISTCDKIINETKTGWAASYERTSARGVKCVIDFEGTYEQGAVLEKIADVFSLAYEPEEYAVMKRLKEHMVAKKEEKEKSSET